MDGKELKEIIDKTDLKILTTKQRDKDTIYRLDIELEGTTNLFDIILTEDGIPIIYFNLLKSYLDDTERFKNDIQAITQMINEVE